MLRIRFIVVDRTRTPFLKEGETLFLKRLRRYAQIDWIEVKPSKITKGRPPQEILDREGRAIARFLNPRDYVVALDKSGLQYDSEGLADWLKKLSTSTGGWICFVIGGPTGLSAEIKGQAQEIFSLSKLTLTHEMCRLFLLEQVYRAFTIMEGTRYHK
jgi:23S rRNA (pseudouridine1915-N3)-methyltransferase